MIQRQLFKSKSEFAKDRISYGGETKGRAKMFRPLNPRKPLHVVMKSSVAKGSLSLLGKKLKVQQIIERWAETCDITIHRRENMGNHLHLFVSFKTCKGIQKFLRTIAGLIARLITKAEKGRAFGRRFWDSTVFTRIITGFRDRLNMQNYMNKNQIERELGRAFRQAMEDYEEVSRKARRRGVKLEVIYQEMLAEFSEGLAVRRRQSTT